MYRGRIVVVVQLQPVVVTVLDYALESPTVKPNRKQFPPNFYLLVTQYPVTSQNNRTCEG